jgi:hypothetical protein
MRRALASACAALLLLALAAGARADGDPASDVLYTQDVFIPYPPPSKASVTALKRSVAAVYAKRFRIKVAVIATAPDLGAVPQMFGKPTAYGRFLGQEISPIFVGPLLIVMRGGYGIYDGGRSTAAEERVLATLPAPGASADELTSAAATAVRKLTATRALRSKDIRKPLVYPQPATGRHGEPVRLQYAVLEDSERTKDTVRILAGRTQKALLKTRMQQAVYVHPHSVIWRVPKSQAAGTLKYCVVATDPAGHKNVPACGQLVVH